MSAQRTIEITINAVNKASPALDGVGSSLQNLGKAALAGVTGVATATAAVGAVLAKLAVDAAPIEGISKAFEGLADSAGVGTDDMLAALKRGSAGMITNRDLMVSFNKAASMISTDFAVRLPDAMGYLGKVSAATGQDMNYMLDSLVMGVGRLSPMILDNLGIQVNLTEANEAYAASMGKTAAELTKSEQQTALMNQVLEKLAVNTASMPDATETAAAKMERFKTALQDTKDSIGAALLPVLGSMMEAFSAIADAVLPLLVNLFQEHLVPALQSAAEFFMPIIEAVAHWIELVSGGADPLLAFQYIIRDLVPPDVYAKIKEITDGIAGFIEQVKTVLEPVTTWLQENVKLQDVLIALGVAITTVVVPVLGAILSPVLAVIATFAAAMAIVVALREAWENDFLGIRTIVENALTAIRQWWTENGDAIMAKAKEIWETVKTSISTALEGAKVIISDALAVIKAWWAEHGDEIMAKAKEIWDGIVKTFEHFKEQFQRVFEAFRLASEGDWRGFGEKLREIWDAAWTAIKEIGAQTWESIRDFFTNTDWGAVGRNILEGIANGINSGLQIIRDAAINAAKAAWDAIGGFLDMDSPSKLFMEVGKNIDLGMAQGMTDNLAPVIGAGAALGSAAAGSTYNYSRTVNLTMQPTQYRGATLEDDARWAATIMGLA